MSARKKRLKTVETILALSFAIGSAFFVSREEAAAKTYDVFISRVQIEGENADADFVEIKNRENCALDLSGWKLRKRVSSGTESSIKVFDGEHAFLPPGETFLWANSKNDFSKSVQAHQESSAVLTDHNSLALFNSDETLIDSLSWGTVSHPFRNDEPNIENPEKNHTIVRSSKASAPSIEKTELPKGNTFDRDAIDFCGVSKDRANNSGIVLSEILADPPGDESKQEFIEIENQGEKSIDLSGWTLHDASKTGKYVFPEGSPLNANSFLVITRATFVFALNNTDETVTLKDVKGETADVVSWDKTKENIALARNGSRWRATKFQTPWETNRFGNDPETKKMSVPKKGFAGIPITFTAKIIDLDRDETKVTWDFGDKRKSYKKDTSHTYKKKGKYTVTLTATDGVADTIKTFHIDIKNYEAPIVRITSLVPNPAGADTGNEYLVITNKSKKEIDLKGWSIATKSKTKTKSFVNHRITKSFIIQPGEVKKLTKKYAAFTLGNTRQLLELRDPRGKTVQKLRYKLETAAPENAEYFKEPDQPWQWRNSLPLDMEGKEI